MLPKTKQKTHLRATAASQGGGWRRVVVAAYSGEAGERLQARSSALGIFQEHPTPSCLGNSACKYSSPGTVPQKGLPILLVEEKTV